MLSLESGHFERSFSSWDYGHEDFKSKSFYVNINITKTALTAQEDTDGDGNITVDDSGPKRFHLRTIDSSLGADVVGSYHLANLLQELTLASDAGRLTTTLRGSLIVENPVDRLRRRITDTFWTSLTRRLDESQIIVATKDVKCTGEDSRPRIYVPYDVHEQYDYYSSYARANPELELDVLTLPKTPLHEEQLKNLRAKPGVLALQMGAQDSVLQGLRYVVPGGRFNELYYWDSYFCALGLLEAGKIDLVKDTVANMIFEIDHYGCVLNGNRSYYLERSQPPFLTDLVLRTYRQMPPTADAESFLRIGILSAIKEYHHVWMSAPRLDPVTGLSRYRPRGKGIPPEVEEGHFDWILRSFADKEGISVTQLSDDYNSGRFNSAELDEFFLHDRATRESGHDTSYRLEGQAADLATIDLNALLYKYETDIAWAIKHKFKDSLYVTAKYDVPGAQDPTTYSSSYWTEKAALRQQLVSKYLWNAESGSFHDYNTATGAQTPYHCATTFYSLWSGLATAEQARHLVRTALPRLETVGGIVSTAQQLDISASKLTRQQQWDFPFGWAPHQVMLWDGLQRYGFHTEAKRLAYRWLYLITRIAVDHNGMVTERYDVTHLERIPGVDAEYGSQGCDFRGVNKEGFGWTNASYVYGLKVIGDEFIESLRAGIPWTELASTRTR